MHRISAQCVDAVRGTLSREALVALDWHVEQCESCAETLRFWHRIAELAERDCGYEPPPAAVDVVKHYMVGHARTDPVAWAAERFRGVVATLVFDSLQQALPAGVRGGTSGARQVLYEAPPLSIDLRLETGGRSQRILLAGQIVHADRSSEAGGGAHVAVEGPVTEVAAVTANQFGEFQCEFDRREDLTLFVSLKDGKAIEIPLDRLPRSGYEDGPADHSRKATS